MNLNAKWLKTHSLVRKELNEEVQKIIFLIKDSILYSSRSGSTFVEYPLPAIFPLIPLDNYLCKLYIYSNVIKKIKDADFDVGIITNNKTNKYIISISWNSHFSHTEIKNMSNIINKYLINTQK